jgi:hypothetical protein
MFRRLLLVSLLALLGTAGAGCGAKYGTSTTVDPLAVFPSEAGYVWDEAGSSLPDEPRLEPLHLDILVEDEVDQAFARRGYRRVATRPTDYRLSYEVRLNTRIEADHSRSLIVLWLTLTEDPSGRNVWTGATQAELHMGLTESERRERLREALDEMLEEFPPEQRD